MRRVAPVNHNASGRKYRMKRRNHAVRTVGLAGLIAACLTVALVGSGIAAAAQPARAGKKPTRIWIKSGKSEEDLRFTGPSTIKQGTDLQVINDTNPKKVGPHTFSIVKRKFLPS